MLLLKSGQFTSTSSTSRVISEEWEVPLPLVPPVVFLLKSEEWTVPPPLVAPVVLLLNRGQFLFH